MEEPAIPAKSTPLPINADVDADSPTFDTIENTVLLAIDPAARLNPPANPPLELRRHTDNASH